MIIKFLINLKKLNHIIIEKLNPNKYKKEENI